MKIFKKKDSLLYLFWASFILTSLVWIALVPIWHTPDEQAHFGQVAFFAQKGRNPKKGENDLTEEIYLSEQFLGTARDKLGNNKFTFHPEYRIEYTNSYLGKYETSISALSKTEAPRKFVYVEASRYPILYYVPAAFIYRLFNAGDLFVRVFAVRFWSLFLFIATVYVCFLIGKLLFPKDRLLSLTLPILVGFQPMMIFANVGVNSDALGNLLFTIFLYLSIKFIIDGFKVMPITNGFADFTLLIFTVLFCLCTKPQFIVTIPLLALISLFIIWRDFFDPGSYYTDPGSSCRRNVIFGITCGLIVFLYLLYKLNIGSFSLINRFLNSLNIQSLLKFTWEYTFPHTYKEVLPWYWGVYDWLGVTYSRIVHRIINWICLFSGVGFFVYLAKVVKDRRWKDKRIQTVIFLIFVCFLYFLAISFYDWLSWYSQKYPLGVQGRYFFPLISVQMLVLLLGWRSLFPSQWKLKQWGVKILALLMMILNFFALYTVAKTYYDTATVSIFITQASQYKPWFFKGLWFVILWLGYIIVIVRFLIEYIRYFHEKGK